MSSTRTSTTGEFRQERYCSAPEFEGDVINGLAAAKRIALVADQSTRAVLWFIQWRSLKPAGLSQLCAELVAAFPERVGSATFRRLDHLGRASVPRKDIRRLREEFRYGNPFQNEWGEPTKHPDLSGDEWQLEYYRRELRESIAGLPEKLKRFCLDPKLNIADGIWFFDDLLGALKTLRERLAASSRARLAETAVTRKIYETLDFWFARRRMVLIEGAAGIGRTASVRAWSDAHAGLVRFVEVPSSSDDRSFFASIARELGVARGTSMKAQEIKVRIEEMLSASEIMLAFDEAQYLWGQYLRPRKTPDRILWVKTTFDAGTPIALIAHTDFSKWQAHYVKQTLWTDEQFERRLNRRISLQAEHSADDMLKIAESHFPSGNQRAWKLLAAYALATEKKQASGIVEALESARYRADRDGRDSIGFGDIEAALVHDHTFLSAAPTLSVQPPCTERAAPSKRRIIEASRGGRGPILSVRGRVSGSPVSSLVPQND